MNTSQKVYGVAWVVLVALTLWGTGTSPRSFDPLAFPSDFSSWTRTTTTPIDTGSQDTYVNRNGLAANQKHGVYPDGSKLLLVSHNPDSSEVTYTLMVKDTQIFRLDSGWGFTSFDTARAPQHP